MLQADTEGYTEIVAAQQGVTPDTKGLIVKFRNGSIIDDTASAHEGRPIFKSQEMITIITPGDKLNVVDRPIWPVDKQRFGIQYRNWKEKREHVIQGTPLEMWPVIQESQRLELEFFHVHTVEQLADLSDASALANMGFLTLKRKAADFLAAAKDGSHLTQLRADLEARNNDLQAMRAQLAEQAKMIEQLKNQQAQPQHSNRR